MTSKFYTNVAVIGNTVYVREVVDGIPSMRKDSWAPTIYVRGKPKNPSSKKFKTLYGEDVYSLQLEDISSTKDFIKQYEGVENFDIFGQLNYSLQYMNEYKPTGCLYSKLSSWAIDIETKVPEDENGKTYFPTPEKADGELLCITLVNMHTGDAFTWGIGDYLGADSHYTKCPDEKTLIKLFIQFWEQKRVDIVTGWNIGQFDMPYLCTRISKVLGEEAVKRLSPWNRVHCKTKLFMGKTEYVVNIVGVSILDYIDLYKKYILTKQESYSLGHISQEELGETKVDHSEYGSFNQFWSQNWEKFTYYNIVDTQLVRRLDNKLRLIELVLTVAYEANVNYEDVSSPVKVWDAIITNYCLARDVVMPQQKREPAGHLDGAYVKEPIPGWYKNVVSLDATSLYPSIIMTNNISPETYVGNCGLTIDDFLANKHVDVDEKYIVTPAGAIYSKETRGVLPELVERFMKMRRDAKNEMLRLEQVYEDTKDEDLVGKIAALDSKQQAIKVLMNSLYGATANEYFRFFKTDHAASITLTGQYVLRTIENHIDAALGDMFKTGDTKFLIYIDTDSLYFTLDDVFKKFNVTPDRAIKTIEKLAKEKITPIVNKFCNECCSNMRSFENKLSFKLEMAADKAIWMGKKKYVLRAHSSEGVTFSKPKFKVKGLEMVRSSTPRFVRDKLKTALDVVFDTNERGTQEYIANVKEEFFKLTHQQIAFPRGANNLAEYAHPNQIYTDQKSVPMQVRAALLYNHHLKKHGVDGKYSSIGEGDKIKFIYLKKPNRVHENTMGFPADGAIPEEFGILEKIDYDTQFEKTFLAAMQIILTPIGWNAEEVSSLEEFF